MTPQERQLVEELFERLSRLEGAPRDADATAAISQGLARAPNAIYPLIQTVLLQEEALKRANARIEELEGGGAPQPQEQPGFLDSMRNSIFGQPQRGGSVPSVRAGANERPSWNTGAVYPGAASQQPDPSAAQGGGQGGAQGGGGFGGSFLGTAAATAAGVIGGSMLMNSIGNLMGGNKHGFGDTANAGKSDAGSPWSAGQSKDDLSREAGVNDIGRGGANEDGGSRQGFFDQASNDSYDDESYDDDDDYDLDGGDSDFA